jgi:DNA (cytosine-5)-methyltransferase 1
LKFFSLFTGAGGVDCAARDLGLEIVGGLEKGDYPVYLYKQNFGPDILHTDILDCDPEVLPDFDVLWASPSCQSFSASNRNRGETQEDILIAEAVAEIIKTKEPKHFILENVRGYLGRQLNLHTFQHTISFDRIRSVLDELNYNYSFEILNARDFGSPQSRKRLILRASQGLPVATIKPTHGPATAQTFVSWQSKSLSISDLTYLTDNQLDAIARYGIDLFKGSPENFLIQRTGYGKRGPILRYRDEPVWTLRASHSCDERSGFRSSITYFCAYESRAYTLSDLSLATLMGFPPNYVWGASKGRNAYAACNAVPVELAKAVLRSVLKQEILA